MCGITGAWWKNEKPEDQARLEASIKAIAHRGPDDSGNVFFRHNNSLLALGHTRLSIIDLSAAGHQPMISACGQHVLVYNGEIYNYKELRNELMQLGHQFTTDTDTEVILLAYKQWNFDCLKRFTGMFAFVLHDKNKQKLFCARDAFGIKPFLYDPTDGNFLFCSELTGLIALRNKTSKLNLQKAYDYLVSGAYDFHEETFVKDVLHLQPGHYLIYDLHASRIDKIVHWWEPKIKLSKKIPYPEAVLEVRKLFLKNIELHLRSDVKLAAALSGGVDSSAIVCAMRYLHPEMELNTFSFIASDQKLDESPWIDLVNERMNCNSHKIIHQENDLATHLDELILAQGEPFGSSSIFAQYSVFKLAREQGFTVLLEGQGADELLAGYNGFGGQRILSLVEARKYRSAYSFAKKWAKWPGRSHKKAINHFAKLYVGNRLYNWMQKLKSVSTPDWINEKYLKNSGIKLKLIRPKLKPHGRKRRVMEQLAYSLQTFGLPHLLRHGDRNSMHFQIESRVPFLTSELCSFLLALPEEYLISPYGESKRIFRDAMRGIVPDEILDRKDKIGFATPEKKWMLQMAPQLRKWIMESEQIPIFNTKDLLHEFDDIIAGKKNYSWQVWRWINFIRWYKLMKIEI